MQKRLTRIIAVVLAVFLLLALVVAVKWSDWTNQAKEAVIQAAETKIEGTIAIGKIELSWPGGVRFQNVSVTDKHGDVIATTPQVTLAVDYVGLVAGREPIAAVREIQVDAPVVNLVQKAGQWNVDGVLKKQEKAQPVFYGRVLVQDGRVDVRTETTRESFILNGSVDAGEWPFYKIAATVGLDGETVEVSGRFDRDGNGELRAGTKQLDIERAVALVKDQLPIASLKGKLRDAQIKLTKTGGNAVWQGRGRLAGAQAAVDGKTATADGWISLDGLDLLLDKVAVRLDGMESPAIATGRINDVLSGDISGVSLQISGQAFPLSVLSSWAPEQLRQSINFDLSVQQFFITAEWQNDVITIPFAQVGLLGGSLSASGEYGVKNGDLQASGVWENLDPTQLTATGASLSWSGVTSGRAMVDGNVKTNKWQGQASVTADAAHIYGVEASALQADLFITDAGVIAGSASGNAAGGSFFANGQSSANGLGGHFEMAGVQLDQLAAPFGVSAGGVGQLTADIGGTTDSPRAVVSLAAQDGKIMAQPFTLARAELSLDQQRRLTIDRAWMGGVTTGHQLQGTVDFSGSEPILDLTLRTSGVRLEPIAALLAPDMPLTGNLEQTLRLTGPLSNPAASGAVRLTDGSAYGQLIEEAQVEYAYADGALQLRKGHLISLDTRVEFSGAMSPDGGLDITFTASNIALRRFFLPPEINLDGSMLFNGKLTGSITQPVFDGRLQGADLSINGQKVHNIVGIIHHEPGLTRVPSFTFTIGSGQYEMNADYHNAEDRFSGRMTAANGELTSVFNIARMQDQAIKGTLNGDVVFDVQPNNVYATVDGEVRDGSWRGLPVQQVDLSLVVNNHLWKINKLEAQQGAGRLVAQGTADLDGDINIELGGTKLDAALLAAAQKTSVPFGGEMNLFAQVSGKTINPNVALSLEISPGRIGSGTFDDLYALITMENKIFKVNQLFIRKGEHQASAYGTVPLAAIMAEAGSQEARENPINLRFKLDKADLTILPFLSSEVTWGVGKTTGEVAVSGTLNDLKANGSFQVQDGTIRLNKLKQPIEKVNIAIAFEGDKIVIQDCSGKLGTGGVRLNGHASIVGHSLANYDLRLELDKPVLDTNLYKGPLDGSLHLYMRNGRPALDGTVLIEQATINIPLLAQSDMQLPFVYLDGVVKLGDKVRLYNPYLYDLTIGGQIDIKGHTQFPRISGRVESSRGTVTYLRTPFKIQNASATWPIPGSFFPAVTLNSQARLSETLINMGVSGTIDALDFQLSSDPQMSRQEIIYLLTMKQRYQAGQDKNGASEFGRSEMMGLLGVGLQARFLSELESTVRDALGLDEFRLFSSNVTTDSNGKIKKNRRSANNSVETDSKLDATSEQQLYNLEVGKYMTDRLMVGYTTAINRQYHTYRLQYDLTRRINLTMSIDQDNDRWYGVEMRFPF